MGLHHNHRSLPAAIRLVAAAVAAPALLHPATALGQTIAVPPDAASGPQTSAPVQAAPAPPPPLPPPSLVLSCEPYCGQRYDGGMVGLRVSTTHVQGSDRDRSGAGLGLQLAGHNASYYARGGFTWRSATFFHIGGGSRGFEGALGGDVAWGYRPPVAAHQGPFVRAGLRGWLLGNQILYSSFFEFPQVQLGYQWIHKGDAVEIGGRGGAVLVGRYNTGDKGMRKLGDAFEIGGFAAAHLEPVHLEVGLTRVMTDSRPGGDVDMVDGRLCGEARVAWLCVDARYYRGQDLFPVGQGMVNAMYAGFSIGAGTAVGKRR